jgi:glycerophosphoryl diester phosphodiesterase
MSPSPYPFQLVAHRGNAGECPENTLPAFQSALDLGLKHLELDVQLSADGEPMVIHDSHLERTAGMSGCVFDMRSHMLTEIEVAEVGRFGERYRGTNIPRLTDVLQLIEGRPDVKIFVEIKKESLRHFGHDQVVGKVLEAIRPAQQQCVIISYDLPAIFRARQVGGATIGWVLEDYAEHTRLKCEALGPEFLFGDQEPLPPRQLLWRGPWEWVIFEVVSLPLAQSLAARGAHHIETMAVRAMSQAMQTLPPA